MCNYALNALGWPQLEEKTYGKVAEALRLMDEEGLSAYSAAKTLGIAQTSVYAAFNRRKLKWLEAKEAGYEPGFKE